MKPKLKKQKIQIILTMIKSQNFKRKLNKMNNKNIIKINIKAIK